MLRSAASPLFVLITLPLCSQDPGSAREKKDLTISAGVITCMIPEYQGSEASRTLVMPMIQLNYKDRIMIGPSSMGNGAGLAFRPVLTSNFAWDINLGAETPRYEKRADALAGMGDHNISMGVGTGVTLRAKGLSARIGGVYGLKDQNGWKGQISLGYDLFFARRWMIGIQTTTQFADSKNAMYEFGITPEQAQRRANLLASGDTRLKPGDGNTYAPGSGLTSIRAGLMANCILSPHWSAMATISINSLQGDARKSPLTKRPTNTATALGMMYRF